MIWCVVDIYIFQYHAKIIFSTHLAQFAQKDHYHVVSKYAL